MIRIDTGGFADFARRLTARAVRRAEAHGENALRARRSDPGRWRLARLLWPDFTQER